MKRPLFSVIIPCFRDHDLAFDAVASCLRQQDVSDFEVVVVDDGSDKADFAAFSARFSGEARVTLLWQPNAGPSAARNAGVQASTGKYLLFLDSDDQIGSRYLSCAREVITGGGGGEKSMVVCPFSYYSQPGRAGNSLMAYFRAPRLLSRPFFDQFCILTGNCFPISSCVVSRAFFNEVGGFDERLTHHEDWDLWIRLIKARPELCYTDAEYSGATYIRMRQGQMSNAEAMKSSQMQVIARHAVGSASLLLSRGGWIAARLVRWLIIGVQLALGYPDQHIRQGRC